MAEDSSTGEGEHDKDKPDDAHATAVLQRGQGQKRRQTIDNKCLEVKCAHAARFLFCGDRQGQKAKPASWDTMILI